MTIQHASIPDAQLHEPKGVVSALSGYVYVSNGSGSGVWKAIDTSVINGLSGAATDRRVLTGASGQLKTVVDASYGVMAVTGNSANFAVTAVADTTLNTASQYQLYTGGGAPWASETLNGITFSTDRLTASVAGVYEIDVVASIESFPSNSASIGLRYRVNGTTASTRFPTSTAVAAGSKGTLITNNLVTLAANDYIQILVASTVSGNLVLKHVYAGLKLIKAT